MKRTHNRLYMAAMIMLLILGVVSCDTRTNNPVRPDFAKHNWLDDYEASLHIAAVSSKGRNVSVLRTITEPINPSLQINSNAATLGQSEYNATDQRWYTSFENSAGFSGSTINYRISYNGKSYSGTLPLPGNVSAAFPSFSHQNDYTINWATAINPVIFVAGMDYSYGQQMYYLRREASPSQRSITFPSNLWNDQSITLVRAGIRAISYTSKTKKLVVYSQKDAFSN